MSASENEAIDVQIVRRLLASLPPTNLVRAQRSGWEAMGAYLNETGDTGLVDLFLLPFDAAHTVLGY
jgi:hypothetical protein